MDGFFAVTGRAGQPIGPEIRGRFQPPSAPEADDDADLTFPIPAAAIDAEGCVHVAFYCKHRIPMWQSPAVLVHGATTVAIRDQEIVALQPLTRTMANGL